MAMQVGGYLPTQHDRFSGGFPLAPVANSGAGFVGLGRDWSGHAWNAVNGEQGLVLVSPNHYLATRHWGGAAQIRVLDPEGVLRTVSQSSLEATNFGIVFNGQTLGDLSLGTTTTAVARVARYGVLDLNGSSTTDSPGSYNNLAVFLYGRGANASSSPRVALTSTTGVSVGGNNTFLTTGRADIQLETGDSGSAVFADWTNPNGTVELAVLGNHAAVNETSNFHNFVGAVSVMDRLNVLMTDDGRALRVVGNPARTWVGQSSTAIGNAGAWGANGPFAQAPSDQFVRFNGSTASNRTVNVSSNHSLRGLYFAGTAGADPFTFGGSSTLTIGRGGVTNYDSDRQVFNAPLSLGSHQFWDAGPGGVLVSNLNTNGRLLEIRTEGTSTINGTISGNGSLALDSGRLVLGGNSTLTGTVWVHLGTLEVHGALTTAGSLRTVEGGLVTGTGRLPGVRGGGRIAPGLAKGILTAASLNPAGGLDLDLEFSAAVPAYGAAAASGNDVLRLTGASPFAATMGSSNAVGVYLDVASLQAGQTFRGGIFTDAAGDFFPSVSGAAFTVCVRDVNGPVTYNGVTYRAYTGPLKIEMTTEPESADFGAGVVAGRVLQLAVRDTFATWAATAFPVETPEADRLPDADPNGDGIRNLMAYALRLDPLATAANRLPEGLQTPAGDEFAFRFRRNKAASDVIYLVETTETLTAWDVYSGSLEVITPDADGDGLVEIVEARVPAGGSRMFGRLRVERPVP